MPDFPPPAPRPALEPQYLVVPRTARYYVVGAPNPLVRDVWIVCHGFSQLARTFLDPFRQFEDDRRLIVAPEALSRFYLDSTPGRTRHSAVGATWMTREEREFDIHDNVTYLDALYERLIEALATHGAARDELRVHALGFSQGAVAVARWAARGSAVIDHLVTWGHGIPDDVNLRALGERLPDLTFDFVHGERDRFVNEEVVAASRAVLEASGIPFRIVPFAGGHVLSTAVLRALLTGD
jgi:predicted esterase